MIDQALIIRMALHFFLVDLFSAPPSWGCMCMEEWWVDVEFAGWHVLRAFRCAPLAWTSNLWPIVFSCFSAEQISNHGRILNGRMHVYIIYTCLSLMNPDQCFDVSVRLKSNGKTELAEVWERLLTWAQDPGNDDEGVSSWCHGIVDVATAVDQIC